MACSSDNELFDEQPTSRRDFDRSARSEFHDASDDDFGSIGRRSNHSHTTPGETQCSRDSFSFVWFCEASSSSNKIHLDNGTKHYVYIHVAGRNGVFHP